MKLTRIAAPAIALAVLAGCAREGDLNLEGGVGISAVRSACPIVGVPQYLGDITLFSGAQQTANAIDVTATITNVRTTCTETETDIVTEVTFDVLARRTQTAQARQVVLPYFVTVVQGGTVVTAKRNSRVALDFAAGADRAQTRGGGTATVSRAAATIPADIREQLTRRRRAGDTDAAVDPLTIPAVREAVQRATFEALVGFQLTDEQLKYNVTR
ncbi:hypothetical protein ACX0GZ_09235 [Sphingomonas aestuarii]